MKHSSKFSIKKKKKKKKRKKPKHQTRLKLTLKNKKTLTLNWSSDLSTEAQINHSLLWTLKQTLTLNTTPPPLPLIDATVASRTDCHRHSENRLPPPPSRTSLSAIIGKNLLIPISHTLFSSCDLSLGCVACVRLTVGLIRFHLICLGFIWFVFGFCLICLCNLFGFVFIFYLYFRLRVCNANDVFDEMLLWVGLIIDKACF